MQPATPRDPIDDLQQQVNALHRAVAGQRTLVIVLGLGLGAALIWNLTSGHAAARAWAQDKGPMEITCRALKVVDDKGKVRLHLTHNNSGGVVHVHNADGKTLAVLEADKDGGFLSVRGHDGKERAFVGVGDKQAGGLIYLKDIHGKNRVNLLVYQDGNGGLSLRNAGGKQEAFFGASARGFGGLVSLNAPDGKTRVIIDCDQNGRGALEMINADDQSEIFLGSSAKGWGGLLNVNAPNGTAGVIMDIDEKGIGRMNLRTKDGQRFVFAGADPEGGTLQVYGLDGKQRAFVGVGDKQSGGVFYLLHPDNDKARIAIGIDNNGIGYGEGRDASGAPRRAMR
ncbi:MAG: hypothetical protein L0Y71_16320 [Gemmataceae bacterium]|nr:hypothetical protein [Gemmataceae bacterium]